jgi:large subunit ribosomal protein L23
MLKIMRSPQTIIKRPILTEKGNRLRETGGADEAPADAAELASKILFEVARDANKLEIRDAVQRLFNVTVLDVRTQLVRGKLKRIGRFEGRRPHWKKAIVTLKAGDTIEFFEGV